MSYPYLDDPLHGDDERTKDHAELEPVEHLNPANGEREAREHIHPLAERVVSVLGLVGGLAEGVVTVAGLVGSQADGKPDQIHQGGRENGEVEHQVQGPVVGVQIFILNNSQISEYCNINMAPALPEF